MESLKNYLAPGASEVLLSPSVLQSVAASLSLYTSTRRRVVVPLTKSTSVLRTGYLGSAPTSLRGRARLSSASKLDLVLLVLTRSLALQKAIFARRSGMWQSRPRVA